MGFKSGVRKKKRNWGLELQTAMAGSKLALEEAKLRSLGRDLHRSGCRAKESRKRHARQWGGGFLMMQGEAGEWLM